MARLTELERTLRRDTDGVVRDNLLKQLKKGENEIMQKLRQIESEQLPLQGLLLLQACQQSMLVITTLWQRYHPVKENP